MFNGPGYNITILGIQFRLGGVEAPGYEIDGPFQPPVRKSSLINYKFPFFTKKYLFKGRHGGHPHQSQDFHPKLRQQAANVAVLPFIQHH